MSKKKRSKSPSPSRPSLFRKVRPTAMLRELIGGSILFTHVHPKTIASIIPKLVESHYRRGEIIFDESTRGMDLFLILRGRVRIKKYTRVGLQPLLAVLHEGDFFGELAIIDGLPRSARAEAVDDCIIARFSAVEFRKLMRRNPEAAYNVLQNLAIRLRTLDQTFVVELERHALAAQGKMDSLNLLIEASKIVNSTIDLDRLLRLILDAARRSINADRGTLYLLDELTNEIRAKVLQGENLVEIRLPLGTGLAGYVAKTGETVNIRNAYEDPRFNPEIDKRSGYKTQTMLCAPMRDKDGHIVGVFQFLNKRDGVFTADDESFIAAFSEHAAIALQNARMARDMVHAERLSAVGRMAAQIIHDIKSPMGTMRVYAEIIRRRSQDQEIAGMSDEMIRQVDRFAKMTQEILDFSRGVSEMKTETIESTELVAAGLSFVEGELRKKSIQVVRDVLYHGPCIVDVEKMVRVFHNLASNAADAMPGGGTLTVRLCRENGMLQLDFIDTGTGIPEELRSRIFDPFFTHGKKLGTGLGLSIVKKIVEDHHGTVEVQSEVNKGTTFRLAIPST